MIKIYTYYNEKNFIPRKKYLKLMSRFVIPSLDRGASNDCCGELLSTLRNVLKLMITTYEINRKELRTNTCIYICNNNFTVFSRNFTKVITL